MIRKLKALVLAATLALLTAGYAVATPQTFVGAVTDTMCGKKHMMPGKSDAECIRECVKAGSKYALLVGDKVYTLSGDTKQIEKLAGKKVKVTGEVKAATIAVNSIAESN
jgi:hypothetical protein